MINSFGGTNKPSLEIDFIDNQVAAQSLQNRNSDKSFAFHGLGKSYGDVALNSEGQLLITTSNNRLLAIDVATQSVRVQTGISLKELAQVLRRHQLALPVTPGTELITVGGAIANDIHGKSHHVHGSFGNQLIALRLIRSDGSDLWCSESENSELFTATIGGLGLTGFIAEAVLRLVAYRGSIVNARNIAFANTDEFFAVNKKLGHEYESSVSWVDCGTRHFGRGIFSAGNFADQDARVAKIENEKKKSAATFPPYRGPSLVNPLSVTIFNRAYFYRERRRQAGEVTREKFFYPLDGINQWNRIYGAKGFYQYQSVIPTINAPAATSEMMQIIKASKQASFLTVIKVFGERAPIGLLSFPMPGVTLAVDFPERGAKTTQLFKDLDRVVAQAGGRLYFAKDARMSREMARTGYPNLERFLQFRDPRISTDLARRLFD